MITHAATAAADRGAVTGFYSLSRGIGIIAGSILARAAISLTQSGVFAASHGFPAVWLVCGAAAFARVPFVIRLRRHQQRPDGPAADRRQSASR